MTGRRVGLLRAVNRQSPYPWLHLRRGRVVALTSSSHGVIAKHVGFQLHLAEPVLENIANADDPHELSAVLDGQVPNPPLRHKFHHISNAVLRRTD